MTGNAVSEPPQPETTEIQAEATEPLVPFAEKPSGPPSDPASDPFWDCADLVETQPEAKSVGQNGSKCATMVTGEETPEQRLERIMQVQYVRDLSPEDRRFLTQHTLNRLKPEERANLLGVYNGNGQTAHANGRKGMA